MMPRSQHHGNCLLSLLCCIDMQQASTEKNSVFYRALTFCTQPLHSAKCNQLDWHCTCNYAPLMKLSVTTQQHNSQVQAQVLCCLFCLLLSIAAQGQACILVHKLWNCHKRYTAHRFKLRVSKYGSRQKCKSAIKVLRQMAAGDNHAKIASLPGSACYSSWHRFPVHHSGHRSRHCLEQPPVQAADPHYRSCLQGLSLLAANLLLTAERAVDVCHQCRNESCCLV